MKRTKSALVYNEDGSVSVELTRGLFAIIDACDVGLVEGHAWYAHQSTRGVFYAARKPKSGCMIYMHRIIAASDEKPVVDHINGNQLDNRRSNLRPANYDENQHNQGVRTNNKSGYKGVSKRKGSRKWQAFMSLAGKSVHLGSFNTPEEAHLAYCKAVQSRRDSLARTA